VVLSGVIGNGAGGAGEMIATGGGTLELQGDNTYTGPTYISGATLEILAGDNLGTGFVAIVDDATLELSGSFALAQAFDISVLATFDVAAGDDVQIFGEISDLGSAGTLVLSGGGVLELSHDNSYSGGTIVKAGTLARIIQPLQRGAEKS
jgi:autotransporter-associated beta strand protein